MKGKFHGVFSLVLITVSMIVGIIALFEQSTALGGIYILIILISQPVILYAFCSKCPCREDSCRHVFPGKLTKIFPGREENAYTGWDLFWTSLALAVLFLFPQYWLWKNKILLILFWIPSVVAVLEILNFVCRGCKNFHCPNCPQN
jgi:hypothetical protein